MTPRSTRAAPSWELALAGARYVAGTCTDECLRDAAESVSDWDDALAVARAHGMGALLPRALRDSGCVVSMWRRAQDHAALDSARTLGQLRLLTRVLAALESAGVHALPYKGPVLSQQLYGDATMRTSVDLDLVVPRESYGAARSALVSLGLVPREGHSPARERTLFRWLGHASFGVGREEFVELHWRLAPLQFPFSLSPEAALGRAGHVRVAGRSVPAMAGDDLIVTLAMHGARHLYERLEWLAGLTRLLLAHDGPVDELVARAASLGARRMLLVSASVSMRMLDAPLHHRWSDAIASDHAAGPLAAEIADGMHRDWRTARTRTVGAELQSLYMRMLDSRADRVRSILRAALLPTQRECESIALPDALVPLYYLVRPLRLVATYAGRAARREGAR